MAILRGGLGGPCPPQIFVWPPRLPPPVFCLISRSSSLDWPIQKITFCQQYFTFMLAPLLFSLAPQWPPHFFHSRIATGGPCSSLKIFSFVWRFAISQQSYLAKAGEPLRGPQGWPRVPIEKPCPNQIYGRAIVEGTRRTILALCRYTAEILYSRLRCVRTFCRCSRVFAVQIVAFAMAWTMYICIKKPSTFLRNNKH